MGPDDETVKGLLERQTEFDKWDEVQEFYYISADANERTEYNSAYKLRVVVYIRTSGGEEPPAPQTDRSYHIK